MSIRAKVIVPYLLLTLLVAITGVYVVTNLVTNTLSERLTNQLLEAGRVISDDMVRQEVNHIEAGRLIAYTVGIPDALLSDTVDELRSIVLPTAAGAEVENLFIYDAQGEMRLHLLERSDGGLGEFSLQDADVITEMVTALLEENNPESLPKHTIDLDPVSPKRFYYTALPIPSNDNQEIVGVVIVGTSVDTLLAYFQRTSFANIILYDLNGKAFGTTFAQSDDPLFLTNLSISPTLSKSILASSEVVNGENGFVVDEREYRLARGGLNVFGTELGLFAVALPLQFVLEPGSDSRNTYVVLFSVAMLFVIIVGYLIARLIINPLSSLVNTSNAITAGDLTKRSGIKSRDEIGILAQSFDEMTSRLQEHTSELERTNKMLEQMDQAKASFIQIVAHELRTPLTLINGYAQMLDSKAKSDPDLDVLSRGLIDGYERMASVVGNMLDISRIDSQMLDVVPGSVRFDLLIMQLEKLFSDALAERKITIEKRGLASLPIVDADPDLIKKALYHLVINAIKYTPDGGRITVHARTLSNGAEQDKIEVVIEDTGIGIEPEHQELIFEKFYQTGEVLLHSTSKTNFKGGGPGLGLAIVKGIIEAHGGRVWVESPGFDEEACPGSKFYLHLPLEERS